MKLKNGKADALISKGESLKLKNGKADALISKGESLNLILAS